MARQLIVNADDFAISAGVSRGILEGHLEGIITSTSVMVNMPNAVEAIRQAQQQAPRLGLGLHFAFSFGHPVSDPATVPSLLAEDNHFCSTYNELVALMSTFDPAHVRAEMQAQFDRFVELAGRLPDHLDSHHGVTEMAQPASEMLIELATRHNLPIRKHMSFESDIRQPEYFEMGFFDQTANFENLSSILKGLQDGVTELMCHPGYADDLEETYAAPREIELRILTDPRIKALIEEEGIQLISFGDL